MDVRVIWKVFVFLGFRISTIGLVEEVSYSTHLSMISRAIDLMVGLDLVIQVRMKSKASSSSKTVWKHLFEVIMML